MRTDRRPWTVALARQRAREILSDMGKGIDHNADKKAAIIERDGALTLAPSPRPLRWRASRQPQERALDRDGRIRRTAVALEVARHRPLADLTVERVQGDQRERTQAQDPDQPSTRGAVSALERRSASSSDFVHRRKPDRQSLAGCRRCSVWRVAMHPNAIGCWTKTCRKWLRRVQSLSPIPRDLQLVTMFTGMRDSQRNQHALGARQPD